MTNKRCYIAGKIGGLTEAEYGKNFDEAKKEVEQIGLVAISPLDLPHNHSKSWPEYMNEDVTAMLTCETVFLLRNWRQSPGATIEAEIALKMGLNIIQQRKEI